MSKNKLIGVPCNLGANKSGIQFCISELLKRFPSTFEGIDIVPVDIQEEDFSDARMKYRNTVLDTCRKLADKTQEVVRKKLRPVIIGGDHSLALGSISGVASEKKIGVVWVDAHADMNTAEITESGHIHGMPLAFLLGHGDEGFTHLLNNKTKIDVDNAIVIGTRDLDPKEEAFMQKIGLKYIPYEVIEKQGLEKTLEEVKGHLKVKDIHISFDLDSLNPNSAPGVSTPVAKGFSVEDADRIFKFLFQNYTVTSVDIVEFNPVYDSQQKTSQIVCDLVQLLQTLA